MCGPTTELLLDDNPANYHPAPILHDFDSPPILIPNEEGKEQINLMDCYRDSVSAMNTWVKKLKSENRVPGIELPASIYPPQWDQRRHVVQAIQTAARDQSNTLLPCVDCHGKDKHMYLRCQRGYLNTSCRKTQPETLVPDEHGIQSSAFKADIKEDTYVNKSAHTRGTEKNEGSGMSKRAKVHKPKCKEDRCEFSIRVDLIPGRCWFLPFRNSKFRRHTKHTTDDLPSHLMPITTNYLTEEEKRRTDIVCTNSSGAMAQNIVTALNKQDNGKHCVITDQALRYRATKARSAGSGPPGLHHSRSERLVEALDKKVAENKIRYVALYHEVTATSLLAISKAQEVEECMKAKLRAARDAEKAAGRNPDDLTDKELKRLQQLTTREKLAIAGELSHPDHDLDMVYSCQKGPGEAEETPQAEEKPHTLEDIHDKLSFGKNLMAVREKLTVGDNIMIGSAWAREDECLLFEKFPEIFMFDVTCKTNNEKRPFGVAAAMDGDMNTFTPFRVFMPSETNWSFNWIFGSVMPALFGADVLDRIQLFLTDGDMKMYNAFDNNQSTYYRHARHGLCMYHLVVQGLHAVKGQMKGLDTPSVRNQLETFKQFLFSWMRVGEIESEEEYAKSRRCLETWLERLKNNTGSEHVKHNVPILLDFLTRRILPHKQRWLACLRQDHLTLHQRTTSALEGVNQTIEVKSKDYVQPAMALAESFECQTRQSDAKMDKYHLRVWKEHESFCSYVSGSKTADWVYRRCKSEITKNQRQRRNYHVRLVDSYSIELLQKKDDDNTPIFCLECSDASTCGPCSEMSPIPRFRRIRTLTFHPLGGKHGGYQVTCSCPYYTTFGIPCRHFTVFCQVQMHHLIVRHHIRYNAVYKTKQGNGQHDEFYKSKQRDMRLKITQEEYEEIMRIAWAKTKSDEAYLFESPRSMMFQRNQDGMLTFARAPTGNGMSVDHLVHRDAFASVEMFEERRMPEGAVTPSPTRTHSAVTPLMNGANNATQNVLSMFEAVGELYKDLPRHFNRIADSLVQFLAKAIEQRKKEIREMKEDRGGEKRAEKRKIVDMYPATDRCMKTKRFKPACEPPRRHARQSRKTVLSIHSQSN